MTSLSSPAAAVTTDRSEADGSDVSELAEEDWFGETGAMRGTAMGGVGGGMGEVAGGMGGVAAGTGDRAMDSSGVERSGAALGAATALDRGLAAAPEAGEYGPSDHLPKQRVAARHKLLGATTPSYSGLKHSHNSFWLMNRMLISSYGQQIPDLLRRWNLWSASRGNC